MLLVLSFIDPSAPSSVKAMFLEQHRDAFTSIFKGLAQDSYSVIRRVLEICWSGLWSDAKLKRTLKIQVFSEVTLSQVGQHIVRLHITPADLDHSSCEYTTAAPQKAAIQKLSRPMLCITFYWHYAAGPASVSALKTEAGIRARRTPRIVLHQSSASVKTTAPAQREARSTIRFSQTYCEH